MAEPTLKPIETRFDGHLFRSRLEARWAVFLKTLGVPYRYEPQGYDLDGLWYLPDFWLPEQQCWVEVKAPENEDHDLDWKKASRLCWASKRPVFMVFDQLVPLGLIEKDFQWDEELQATIPTDHEVVGSNRGWFPPGRGFAEPDATEPLFMDGCCTWGECPICHKVGIDSHGQHELCACKCSNPLTRLGTIQTYFGPRTHTYCATCPRSLEKHPWFPHETWKDQHTPRLLKAYESARFARFEHGETPR